MKCSEIMEVCRKLAPEDCACDWDNPCLLYTSDAADELEV